MTHKSQKKITDLPEGRRFDAQPNVEYTHGRPTTDAGTGVGYGPEKLMTSELSGKGIEMMA